MVLRIFTGLLFRLSQLMLWVKRPTVIGVTGNFGKTSTVSAIVSVLRSTYSVRGPEKNFNNEIGVPLTILGWPNHRRNILGWLIELIRYPLQLLVMSYPSVLVLEMGVDKPGDMLYLIRLVQPHVAVVTGIGEIPVHVEFFGSPEAVREEKAELVKAVPNDGLVILNGDDLHAALMRSYSRASVLTYGTAHLVDISIQHTTVRYQGSIPEGIYFQIVEGGSALPVRLSGSLNLPQAFSAAAAYAAGGHFGIPKLDRIHALEKLAPPKGRMNIIRGKNNSLLLDDTYNAAPAAMESAIVTLAGIEAKRRVAILGDMKELGEYTKKAHKKIGDLAKSLGIVVIGVGEEMQEVSPSSRFQTSEAAAVSLASFPKEGDVILIKGAQSMRMERIVEALMLNPDLAKDLLVRQTEDWKRKRYQ